MVPCSTNLLYRDALQYQSSLPWHCLLLNLFVVAPRMIHLLGRETMSRLTYILGLETVLCPAAALWSHVVQFRKVTLCGSRLVRCGRILYQSSGVWYRVIPIFWGCGAVLYPFLECGQSPYLLWRRRAVPTFHCLSAAMHDMILTKVAIMLWASKQTKVGSHRHLLQTVRMSCSTMLIKVPHVYFPLVLLLAYVSLNLVRLQKIHENVCNKYNIISVPFVFKHNER
jgi:hypothetical protein